MSESIDYRDLTIKIEQDDDPPDPRKDWDHFGTIACWHDRYNLGDKDQHEAGNPNDFMRNLAMEVDPTVEGRIDYWENGKGWVSIRHMDRAWTEADVRVQKIINRALDKHVVILPLYLFDHSGITISCSSARFRGQDSMGWDWGKVGFIYATREMIAKEYGRFTKKTRIKAQELLESEVKTYAQYLENDVWHYQIEDKAGEHLDSCGGFYGYDYCVEEAKSSADHYAQEKVNAAAIEKQEGWCTEQSVNVMGAGI